MEKLVGPVQGYYAAIFASELNGKFRASYKLCELAPADYRSACPVSHARVKGTTDSLAQAFELAERLALLNIARLGSQRQPFAGEGVPPSISDARYADTEPSPLYAHAEPSPLYAATEPAPLYAGRAD